MGIVLPPNESVDGSVKVIVIGLAAWPATSKRPALVRSVASMVLFTPGKTFAKFSGWAPTTLIGASTVAVTLMLALLLWARRGAATVTAKATATITSVSLEKSLMELT